MSVPNLGNAAVNATFLPNRNGILKRDTKLRAKAHRMALESIQGDVDTGQPLSMQFSRGQKVDMKKLRQEATRSEYVEKCNRKLVDKMMMIMQGLCGTIVSGQKFPDFNPGTLNYRIRQRELLRIDRANSALLHRLETASSGYNKARLKPKHFQEPHMGLFPRSANSVKSGGSRSGKRTRPLGSSSAPSGGGNGSSGRVRDSGNRQLGWETSVTSVLTDDSAFPTTTLGKFHDASSRGGIVGPPQPGQELGERKATELSGSFGNPDGGGSLETVSGLSRTPHPPSISSRATCGSTSGTVPSTLKRCRRLAKATPVRPGAMVFQGGVKVSDEYALMTVNRATEGFGEDGSQGFQLRAYFPVSLAVHTLGVGAAHLPAFTGGSHTAVRHLFLSGEKSRRKWEKVAMNLELRPWSDSSSTQNSAEEAKRVVEPKSDSPRRADNVGGERSTAMTAATAAAAAETATADPAAVAAGPSGGLEGAEGKGSEATVSQAAEGGAASVAAAAATAVGPGARRFEMVLVPPQDVPIIIIQRVVRGLLMRANFKTLKRAILIIQAAVRSWKYRMAKRQYEAATKIAAITRGKQGRNRVKQERAARGIQKHSRSWLRKRKLEKEKAAKQIQGAVRRRHESLRARKTLVSKEEALLLSEGITPKTTTATRGGGGASERRHDHKDRPAFSNKRRSPGFSQAPKPSSSSTSSSIGSDRRTARDGVSSGGGRGAGTAPNKITSPVPGGVGGGIQGRGGQDRGGGGPGNPKKVAASGGGQHDAESGSSGGPRHERGMKSTPGGTGNGMKGGGGGKGGGSGVAAVAAAGAVCTPPRNQRPRPPGAKDFTRSPYNRSAGGRTRGGRRGGGGGMASKNSPPAGRSSAGPRKGTHDGEAGRNDQSSVDAPTGGISVAPPPLPKSSAAAPRVAGAWPSGGAGTRTARAAADATAARTTTTPVADAASLAEGTSKPSPASQGGSGRSTPRSASGGTKGEDVEGGGGEGDRRGVGSAVVAANEKWSSASGRKEPEKPSSERAPDALSQKVADEKNTNKDDGSGGNNTKLNRQHRSSSIPWVEAAATGKHYRPPSPGKAAVEPAVDSLVGNTSPETTARRPSTNPTLGAGQQYGDNNPPHRRTSSVSWAEDIVAGKGESGAASSPKEAAVKAASRGANSDGNGSGREGGGDNNPPHRRTSSVSWAEDIVAGKGESGAASSPKEAAVKAASRGADSDGDGSGRDGGGDSNPPHRRTSSVSWAEDIVARAREETVHPRNSAAA